jgi:hypothetical protein
MQGNFTAVKRTPATIEECKALLAKCHDAWYQKTQVFTEPKSNLLNHKDLDGTRNLLENILSAWRH